MIEVDGLPTKKMLSKETRFNTVKTRNGRKSVPFMNLESGLHEVKFKGKRKSMVCEVKVWLSLYGWAWHIERVINDGL